MSQKNRYLSFVFTPYKYIFLLSFLFCIQVGKLYISDYKPLTEHLKRNDGLHCTDSCGLFYVKNGEFLPIAIQLVPGDRDYLFIADGSDDWLLAKMYFRCTMGSIHEVSGREFVL